jgi:hypothetical protein
MAYGARVSRAGFKASTCADFESAFDSRYPNLKIAFQGAFTTNNTNAQQTIVTHSLGYAPVFWFYVKDKYGTNNVTLARTGYSQFFRINGTDLVYDGGALDVLEIYYYIFHQQINQNITYNTVSNTATTPSGSSNDYGIRVSKSGFDVKTTAAKNLAWSSEYPSPIIQKMVTGTLTSASQTTVSHGLNYYPQHFLYIYDIFGDSRWSAVINSSFDLEIYSTNANVLFTFFGFNATYDYGLLILKDPINV